MQAHPQSNPAARIHRTPPGLPPVSTLAPPPPDALPPVSTASVSTAPAGAQPPAPPASPLADAAGLAHDAGNLLQALGLYCELLGLPGVLRPEHAHYAAELTLISNRSAELIRRLLALPPAPAAPAPASPATAAPASTPPMAAAPSPAAPSPASLTATDTPLPPEHRAVSVRALPHPADILRDIAPVLQSIASGAASVIVTCSPALAYIDFPSAITAEVIERITVNLVRNASEALRQQHAAAPAVLPRSEVRVHFGVTANRLQLTVEDTGPGMPPSAAAAFLHPSPLPAGARRGLGHRIVHELATGSGGHIAVRVRPGNGTLFTVRWPLPVPTPPRIEPSRHALTS